MKNITITKELQETVRANSHVSKVYFDAKGRHYFNVHELPFDAKADKDKIKMGIFGSGVYSHNQVIPGKTNIEKLTEVISSGDPDTLIVETMTRDEVLNANAKSTEDTLAVKFLNSSESEQQQFLNTIGLTPDVLEALKSLKKSEEKVQIALPS